MYRFFSDMQGRTKLFNSSDKYKLQKDTRSTRISENYRTQQKTTTEENIETENYKSITEQTKIRENYGLYLEK